MRVSHYELYEGRYGQWVLAARYQPRDEMLARTQAEARWTQARVPVILTQEAFSEDGGELHVSAIYRSPGAMARIQPPALEDTISNRIVTVAVGGVAIGLLGAIVGGAALSSAGLGLLLFVVMTALGMMALFRMMVPAEFMMWRNKPAEAKRKTIETLIASANEDAPEAAPAGPAPNPQVARRKRRKGAFSHGAGEAVGATVIPGGVIDGAASLAADVGGATVLSGQLQELVAKQTARLVAFAAEAVAALGPQAAALQAFDRYGIHLYLAGAAQELAWRESLTATTLREILVGVLAEQGVGADAARVFCERLPGAQNRPRYKAMLDAGRTAMAAVVEGRTVPDAVRLPTVLRQWSNPHDKAAGARRYAVLLTDIIGSTDATRKLGNSGAQRMLRAHNAIVRGALKQNRGTEVKHTGDGLLAIFDKPADAVEAARAIQQDVFAYVKDNPDVPLALRIGIEYGDGALEGGEFFGPAFTAIEGTCDAAGAGDIAVTPAVRDRAAGANVQFAPLTPSPTAKMFVPGLFKLLWEPKPVYNAPPLEYRQIGGVAGQE